MKALALASGNDRVTLYSGEGACAFAACARREPLRLAAEGVEEQIDLLLEHPDPAAADAALAGLMRILRAAGAGRAACLRQVNAAGEPWESRLVSGSLAVTGGERGALRLRLTLLRQPGWQGTERELPLNNRGGTRVTGGLRVTNHCDGGADHDNFVQVDAGDLAGELPAPLRLELRNVTPGAEACDDLWVGCSAGGVGPALPGVLEAEDAWGALPLADGASSGGAYVRAAWSAPGEASLLRWTLPPDALGAAAGRWFRPVLRLAAPAAYTDLWLGLRMGYGGASGPAQAGPPGLVPAGVALVELPVLRIPPFLPEQDLLDSLELELYARRLAGGSGALDVDCLFLLPLDGWRCFASCGGLRYGWRLIDDGIRGETYGLTDANARRVTHVASGPPLTVTPGLDHRIHFLQASGGLAPIERRLEVRAFYRPLALAP